MRQIVTLGGGGFSMEAGNPLLDEFVLDLTGRERPRICFLPSASGDADHYIVRFYRHFCAARCEPSHLSLFRRERAPAEPREHLLAQDLIYVGGGSMVNLMAILRAHGLDEVLRRAWERGVALAGQSAGAMCWFEWGVTRSAGAARLAPGLGFVPGVLSVHYHRDPERRRVLIDAVARRGWRGHGLDDGAGLLLRGDHIATPVTGREEAGVWQVAPDGRGRAREHRLDSAPLPSPRPGIDEVGADVVEMRRLRALRSALR